tara:strand:- start:44 stop:199 length:156 start_codon:yes stop_codon:yes gene_type:complete
MYIHLIYITIIVGLLYWNFIIQDNVSPYLKSKEENNINNLDDIEGDEVMEE